MKARKPKTKSLVKRPSPKRMLWLKHYTTPGTPAFLNAMESARQAGYQVKNDQTYGEIGYQNFKILQPILKKWMDDEGLTTFKIKSKVLSLMDAKKTHFEKAKGDIDISSLAEGVRVVAKTKSRTIIDEDGNEIQFPGDAVLGIEVDALEIQAKGADLAAKVQGLYEPESRTGPKAILNVTIEVYRDPDAPIPVGPLKIAEKTA